MPYRLKKEFEAFTVVSEGRWEGQTFRHGVNYDQVPELEAYKFEQAGQPAAVAEPKPARRKKGGMG